MIGSFVFFAALVPPAWAQGTITTGDAVYTVHNFGVSPTTTARVDLEVNPALGIDHLFEHWWYYRVEGGPDEQKMPPPTTAIYEDDPGRLEYLWQNEPSLPFSARRVLTLHELGANSVGVMDRFWVWNTSPDPLAVTMYAVWAADVRDTFGGNQDLAVELLDGLVELDDQGTFDFAHVVAFDAQRFEVRPWPQLRDVLLNGLPNDFDNSGLPAGPNPLHEVGYAFQLKLAPGARQRLRTAFGVNFDATTRGPFSDIPRDPAADLLAMEHAGVVATLDTATGDGWAMGASFWTHGRGMSRHPLSGAVVAAAGSSLITIDPTTGTGSFLVGVGPTELRAIAHAGDGTLYGVSRSGNGDDLVVVDTGTGSVALVGPTGLGAVEGLAFAPDDTLVAWDEAVGLVVVDAATGQATDIDPAVPGSDDVRGLAFRNGVLYGARHRLFTIAVADGSTSPVGLGDVFDVNGLAALP